MQKKILTLLVLLMTAVTGAWAQTGENIFQYCYDCQRNPAYPKTTASASLSGFANPLVGYKGSGFDMGNTSDGPWKLEYMGIWSTTDKHEIDDVSYYQSTYNCTDVPVFRLYQWNATANEYQHAAYGVVCCYAKVSNTVEHTALFVAQDGWGCVLTNSSHSSSMNITFDEDLTTGLTTLIAAATPAAAGPEVTWDATTKQATFEMPAYDVELQVEYYPAMLSLGGDAIEGGKLEIVELVGTTSFTAPSEWNHNTTKLASSHFEGFKSVTEEEAKAWPGVPTTGKVALFYNYDETEQKWDMIYFTDGAISQNFKGETQQLATIYNFSGYNFSVFYTTGMQMPAGFEKDAEGNIYVAEGTTFTVKATPEEGYHFVCWSDDETNTNPEREITMPEGGSDLSLSATFAENEYDITFSEGTNPDPENPEWTATPNPAKTKQTVTVTYTGTKKVIGVKAEKKASAPTLKDALADGATVVITYTWYGESVTTFTYTNNGGTYTGSTTGDDAEYFNNGMSMSGTTLRFTASNPDHSDANVNIEFYTDTNEYYFNSKGSGFTSFTISVNGTDLTSQLKEVK